MPFNDNFEITNPIGTDLANQIDAFIRKGAKSALAERYEIEHFALQLEDGTGGVPANSAEQNDANAQGRHIPGKVGSMGQGTLAERAALGQPGSDYSPGYGALFLCTEEDPAGPYPAGTVFRFDVDGWTPSQLKTAGTVYASQTEVDDGAIEDKALCPLTHKTNHDNPDINWPLRGMVDFDGTLLFGLGFTTSQISAGKYQITYDTPGDYIINATCFDTGYASSEPGGETRVAQLWNSTNTGVEIWCKHGGSYSQYSTGWADAQFHILIFQRTTT